MSDSRQIRFKFMLLNNEPGVKTVSLENDTTIFGNILLSFAAGCDVMRSDLSVVRARLLFLSVSRSRAYKEQI